MAFFGENMIQGMFSKLRSYQRSRFCSLYCWFDHGYQFN